LLGEWGIPKDSAAGREVFAARMEARRARIWNRSLCLFVAKFFCVFPVFRGEADLTVGPI
jgi:hypothetical protein